MLLKPMAMKINAENYSVAAACCETEFLFRTPTEVFGKILVINVIMPLRKWTSNGPADQVSAPRSVGYINKLLTPEQFNQSYITTDKRKSMTQFVDVVPV